MKARCSRKTVGSKPASLHNPKGFGDMMTADHAVSNEGQQSRKHDTVALVVQGLYMYWRHSYPAKHKSDVKGHDALRRPMDVGKEAGHVWTDGAEEFSASLARLPWAHEKSLPSSAANNGLIERAVQRAKRATLHAQSTQDSMTTGGTLR